MIRILIYMLKVNTRMLIMIFKSKDEDDLFDSSGDEDDIYDLSEDDDIIDCNKSEDEYYNDNDLISIKNDILNYDEK